MNRRIGILCLLAVIALAGCRRTQSPPTTAPTGVEPSHPSAGDFLAVGEFSMFAGTWVVTSAKYDGEDLPNQVGQEYYFAAGKLTLRQGDRVLDTAKVVLDPSAKPKAVDFISDHPKEGEPPPRYIYEFDGQVLRLCTRDKERPTSFGDKEQIVFTLKRKKG